MALCAASPASRNAVEVAWKTCTEDHVLFDKARVVQPIRASARYVGAKRTLQIAGKYVR